jgi:hypothetical protein
VQVRGEAVEQRRRERRAAHAVAVQEAEGDPEARGEHEVDQGGRDVGRDDVPASGEPQHVAEVPELQQRAGPHHERGPGHAAPQALVEVQDHAAPPDEVQPELHARHDARARRDAQRLRREPEQHAHDERGDEAQRDEVRQREQLG